MKNYTLLFPFLFILTLLWGGCTTRPAANDNIETDPMKQKVGVAMEDLEIGVPQGSLGNFVSDAMLGFAQTRIDEQVQLSFIDNAALNTPLKAGPVSAQQIYSLFNKDHRLSLVLMKGSKVRELFAYFGEKLLEGSPETMIALSGGKLHMTKGRIKEILINGQSLKDEVQYKVITTGDLVNDGRLPFMNTPGVQEIGSKFTIRPGIVEYLRSSGAAIGGPIDARIIMEY